MCGNIQAMSLVYITRKETFAAAHKLNREDWSDEQNHAVFGKCANANWHGHNYTLYITVKGQPAPDTGFVVNLSELSEVVRRKIINQLDHKNLNLDVPFMVGKMTSTEVLAVAIWDELVHDIQKMGCALHCIKVQETDNNHVEYFGEN